MAARQQQMDASSDAEYLSIDVDQMFPQVPGYCYMQLLQQQTDAEQIAGDGFEPLFIHFVGGVKMLLEKRNEFE